MFRPFVPSLVLAAALAAPAAFADSPAPLAAPTTVEHLLSMSVEGRVVVEIDGSVREYSLDTQLAPQLAGMLGKAIVSWRFQPVLIDGKPRRAEARMRISLAAQQTGENYQVRVDNVVFLDSRDAVAADRVRPKPAVEVTSRKMTPPVYPNGLMRAGVDARVLVALHFSPTGEMLDVVPVQTMIFDTHAQDPVFRQAMAQFEEATLAAARKWRVNVELQPGATTTAKDFTAYTTVEYISEDPGFGHRQHPRPQREPAGKWRTVVRSPKRDLPWLSGLDAPEVGVADVQSGEVLPLAGAPRLTTPVAGTAL